MDLASLLRFVPPAYLFCVGLILVSISILLNVCGYLRSRIPPPDPGSRWTRLYQIMSILAFEQKYASAIYKIGMTAVLTTRAEAPLLKKAGVDSGVQILDSKGKPKAPT